MNKLIDTGNWVLRANIHRIDHPREARYLSLTSQLRVGRHPDEQRQLFGITLMPHELTKLRDLIDLALLETRHDQETA